MTLFHAVVLAIVQGLTEFLPISSSAHLWFFPWALHWPDGGLPFDVALHAGTLAAVLFYFLGTWIELVLNGIGVRYPVQASDEQCQSSRRLFWFLVIGTIPGAVVGFLFERFIEDTWRNPIPIAAVMIAVALLMALVESIGGLRRVLEQVTLRDSVVVGLAQALALFPGVSRSGITIVAGLWRKMTRETAARFSFLLGLPAIALAGLKELAELRHAGLDAHGWSVLILGLVVASLSSFLAIWALLRILERFAAWPFVVYRALLGAVLLAGVATGWLG